MKRLTSTSKRTDGRTDTQPSTTHLTAVHPIHMYWKYHIESGDLVSFDYQGSRAHGTVRGWLETGDVPADATVDDVEPSDFVLRIQSGQTDVDVPLPDITSRVDEDERKTDIPLLSEAVRLNGGVDTA